MCVCVSMCVCVHVCVGVCVCVCVHAHLCVCIVSKCMWMHTCLFLYAHVWMYVCVCVEFTCLWKCIRLTNSTSPLSLDLSLADGGVQLGDCSFSETRTGVMALTPNGDKHLALVLMGTSIDGLVDIVSLATPTIPPMARSPVCSHVCNAVQCSTVHTWLYSARNYTTLHVHSTALHHTVALY